MIKETEKKIRELTDEIKGKLKWTPVEEVWDCGIFEIMSDERNEEHVIKRPRDNHDEFYDLGLLHEYVHALFHERYGVCNPMCPLGTPQDLERERIMVPVFRAANDWFVDGWLKENAPEAITAELAVTLKEAEAILSRLEGLPYQDYMRFALLIAEANRFFNYELPVDENTKRIIDALWSASSLEPSLENLETLVNR